MSTPDDKTDSEAEPQNDGLRSEIEQILREQGEKPVPPRPPSARNGGPIGNLARLVRGFSDGDEGVVRPSVGSLLRASMLLLLIRLGLLLVFAFFSVRVLGPRAIILFMVIALVVLAFIVLRYMIERNRGIR